MATSDGQLKPVTLKFWRDARQSAGLTVLCLIGIIVAVALVSTIMAGWSGNWDEGIATIRRVTFFTLRQALLSVLLSLCLAVPIALALENLPTFSGRRFILSLFTIPLSLPVIVAVMALLTLFGRNGLVSYITEIFGLDWKPDIYGLTGILLSHIFFNMPLAVRIIVQRFEAIAQEQWKLAESLRFNGRDRFRHLHWPALAQILPGLSGLIFLLCVGSYTTILVLGGGPQTTTVQVAIYQALSFDFDIARAATLTLIQLGIIFMLLWILPDTYSFHAQSGLGATKRYHRTSAVSVIISTIVIDAGALLIALPLAAVVLSGFMTSHLKLLSEPLLWRALATSFVIGSVSALMAVSAAWALLAAQYSFLKNNALRGAWLMQSVPLALLGLPSLVLGAGWFLFLIKTGLPLLIAPLFIVLANAMMALPFAIQIIQPKLYENFDINDRLAHSLDITGLTRIKLIDLPVMRSVLTTASLFTFALSLGDLGVVTLFGADQILTLPALIFQKMGSYRNNDAAGLALYLALLTGLLTFFATKVRHNAHE
jgi:thiamine transport system permease protein